MSNLQNQVVLITGCSSGIGRSLAIGYAKAGHQVIATARNIDSIEDLKSDKIAILPLDVTDNKSIDNAVGASLEKFGAIDILINNAGFGLMGPMVEIPLDVLRMQFETNVIGALALIQAVVPAMIRQSHGRIINIGSVSGITATPFSGAYCGSKAALHLISDSMRMELKPFGIDVMVVQPGGIQSSFADNAKKNLDKYFGKDSMYNGVREGIEERAKMSQTSPTSADDFAADVIRVSLKNNPPAVSRFGHGSTLLPTLKHLLPTNTLDGILSKKFKLKDLNK